MGTLDQNSTLDTNNAPLPAKKKKRRTGFVIGFSFALSILLLFSKNTGPKPLPEIGNKNPLPTEQSSQSTTESSGEGQSSQATPPPFEDLAATELPQVQVPDVIGKPQTEAEAELKKLAFFVEFQYAKYTNIPENSVAEQQPKGGELLAEGSTVILKISSGKPTISVEAVVGKTAKQAESLLKSQGFQVSVREEYSNTVATGVVISQSPSAGSGQFLDTTIVLTVSKGPKPVTLTFDPKGGNASESTRTVYCGRAFGALPTASKTGFTFAGWHFSNGETLSSSTTVTNATALYAYAKWIPNAYSAKWSEATGCTIKVERTASPNQGAATGALTSGAAVYYGDVLKITYGAKSGYTLTGKGSTSITVTGNVTASQIYATASNVNYTYTILYRSSNNIDLGKSSANYAYGTVHTITAPAKSGYATPSAQTVVWDTPSKIITFTYEPLAAENATKTGYISNYTDYKLSYSANIECQNRTATSVQLRVVWTSTLSGSGVYNAYGQRFTASVGSVSTGVVVISNYGTWSSSSFSPRSVTKTSDWITVPLDTTNATTVSMNIHYYQANYHGTDMTQNYGVDGMNTTWTINIPAC